MNTTRVLAALALLHAGVVPMAASHAEKCIVLRNPKPSSGYDYAAHLGNLRTVLDALRNGFAVGWISKNNRQATALVRRGDFLVPIGESPSRRLSKILSQVPRTRQLQLDVDDEFEMYSLRYPRIQLDGQVWASNYYWYYDTLSKGGFEFSHVLDFRRQPLDARRFNLYIAPGGGGKIPPEFNKQLRAFVKARGNYVGSCWGCAQAIYPSKVSYGSGNGAGIADAHNNEVTRSFGALGGVGHIILKNEAPDHPIMWDQPKRMDNIYWNGPVMRPGPFAKVLASFVEVADDFSFHSRRPQQRKQDADEERGKCMYLTSQRPDEGRVVVFGNHPEASSAVSPFAPHSMGNQATFQAILYATAGKKTRRLSAADVGDELAKDAGPWDALAEQTAIAEKAQRLSDKIRDKLSAGKWTEDDNYGFYLLRLQSALQRIKGTSLKIPAAAKTAAPGNYRRRALRWGKSTVADLAKLEEKLPQVTVRLNRRSTRMHPIVCPLLERDRELQLLQRDMHYRMHLGK